MKKPENEREVNKPQNGKRLTRRERRAKRAEDSKKIAEAIASGNELKKLDEDEERHTRMVNAVIAAGIKFKQINSGHISVHYRGEKGDGVSFHITNKNYFTLLKNAGAFDPCDYTYAMDRFYGAWRSYLITMGAYQGAISVGQGEDRQGEPLEFYSYILKQMTKSQIESLQFACRDIETIYISDKEREYVFSLTGQIEQALKALEKCSEEFHQIVIARR